MGQENLEIAEEDDEFGPPESVQVDFNSVLSHLMRSFSADIQQQHLARAQHAAEAEAWRQRCAELEGEKEAMAAALESEQEYIRKLEGALERESLTPLDPALLAEFSGRPGLHAAAQSAESSTTTVRSVAR